MNKTLFANFMITILIISFLATSVDAYTNTCAISTGKGLLQDFDCDGVPDMYDNCPDIPNPDQTSCFQGYGMYPETQPVQQPVQQVTVAVPSMPEPKPKVVSDFGITNLNVKIKETQDVYLGTAGAVYPIKVTNNGREDKRVIIEVLGVDFGSYRIDPVNALIVKAGKSETAFLHISARDDTEEGKYPFELLISSGDESESVDMKATVYQKGSLADQQKNTKVSIGDVVGWILVIAIIVIIAVLVGREERKGGRRKKIDKDIYSYY